MFCKPVSTLAVAALLLAGAAEAQGGARSVSTLSLGSFSSTADPWEFGFDAFALTDGFPTTSRASEASAETFADPGYEASADVTGESLATATDGEDDYAFGRFFADGSAFTGSDGSTEANTLLEAATVAAQLDEGTAAGGSFGGVFAAATPTTDEPEDFDGATAESVLPGKALRRATTSHLSLFSLPPH